jgi:hypothetical protein
MRSVVEMVIEGWSTTRPGTCNKALIELLNWLRSLRPKCVDRVGSTSEMRIVGERNPGKAIVIPNGNKPPDVTPHSAQRH